ncbi:unnamed protein product [Brachionus calyciflorus]|uniref:FLYWCH-type domain-containing protein n=1 Tax=Brachionus calyciflorus TaxID=104777 RepID=A0A813WJ02_9BILA|nr:unnamed protein product [Brachionus calyciflorus]
MSSKIEFVPSNKGGLMLFYEEHLYQKLKKPNKDGTQAWRCRDYRLKNKHCKALCYTLDNKVVAVTGQHLHQKVNKTEVIFSHAKQVIKELVKTDTAPIKKIFEKTINKTIGESQIEIAEAALFAPKYRNIEKGLYSIRHENIVPFLPKKTNEILFSGAFESFQKTTNGKRFLFFDTNDSDRIIAFASDTQLGILSRSKRWHVDGTFKAAPTIFYQLYMIHAWDLNEMHACAFIFLTSKSQLLYSKMLRNLIEKGLELNFSFSPNEIVSDF